MSETTNTIICPHCGASTTNHNICDYCGSKIVMPQKPKQTKNKNKESDTPYANEKERAILAKSPLLGKMILNTQSYIDSKKKSAGNEEIDTCQLEIWDANNKNAKYAIHIEDYAYSCSYAFIITENGSEEFNSIKKANLSKLSKITPVDILECEYKGVRCMFDVAKYTIFKGKLYKSDLAENLINLFAALGVDEHNLRYHYWFTGANNVDDYFDGEGNLMETKPAQPSLRIFGKETVSAMLRYVDDYHKRTPLLLQKNAKFVVTVHIYEQQQGTFGGQEMVLNINFHTNYSGGDTECEDCVLSIPIENNSELTDKQRKILELAKYDIKLNKKDNCEILSEDKRYIVYEIRGIVNKIRVYIRDSYYWKDIAKAINTIYREVFNVDTEKLGYCFSSDGIPTEYYNENGVEIDEPTIQQTINIADAQPTAATPAQQPTAAAQTATEQQSQGINFGIIALILMVVGGILGIVGFFTINVIMLAIGVAIAFLGYFIISVI